MQSGNAASFAAGADRRRRRSRSGIAAFAAAVGAGSLAIIARAQTVYIYTPDNATTYWTSGTQSGSEWTTGGVVTAPVSSSTATILTFGQTSAGTTAALDGITNVNTYNASGSTFSTASINLEGMLTNTSDTGSVTINGTGAAGVGGSTIDVVTSNNASFGIFADANASNVSYVFNVNLQLGNNADMNGNGSSNVIFNGVVSGGSNFIKNSPYNTMILTGNNTFGAYNTSNASYHGLEVFQGTVQIGNGGTSGTPGNQAVNGSIGALILVNNVGILAFDRTDNPTFTNAIELDNGTAANKATLNALAGSAVTLTGPISTLGEILSINPTGDTGTINLANVGSNYSSGTQVSGGIINVSGNQSGATGGWIVGPQSLYTAMVNFSSGSTIVSSGAMRIGYASASNTAASLLVSAGTVNNTGTLAIDRIGTLNISAGTWTQNGSMAVNSLGGQSAYLIVGPSGSFNYNGSSAIALNASGSASTAYYAEINVSGGIFTTSQAINENASLAVAPLPNATLILDNGGTLALSANIPSLITVSGAGIVPIPMELGNGSGGVINTAGFNTSIAQVISNLGTQAGTFTLTGGGNLTLAGFNTYTGPTNVSSGTLIAGAAFNTTGGAFGLNSELILANSATAAVSLAGFNTTIGSLTGGGASGGNMNLSSATLTVGSDNTSPPAYAGAISGTGGLTKIGSGKLILSGSNTYSGPTNISAGMLNFTQRVALYTGNTVSWTAANITVASGATMDLNVGGTGEFVSSDLDTLLALGNATGGFLSGSTIALDTTNAAGGNFTYNTSISNPNAGANTLALTKLGSNALTLNGNNSYTGLTTVTAGTLIINGNDSAATGGWNIIPSNLSTGIPATANVSSGAIVTSTGPITIGETVTGSSYAGTFNILGTVNNSGNLTIQRDGNLIINAGGVWNQTSGTVTLYPGSATSYGSTFTDNGIFNYTGSSPIAINPSATYPGVSKLTIAGLLSTTQGFTATTSTNTGTGTLALAGGTLALNSSSGIAIAASPLLVTTTGNSTIDMTNSPGTNTIGSAISGTGGLTLQGSGGTLILSGANNYSGATVVTSGTLTAGAASALSPNSAFNVTGGTLNTSSCPSTIAALTVGSGGTLTLGYGNVLTDTSTASLAGRLVLTGTAGTTPETLMTYTSETGSFTGVTGVPPGDTLLYSSTALELVVGSSGPATLTWNNAGGSGDGITWDTVQQNWNNGSAVTAYSNNSNGSSGDNVTFNDNNNGHYNVSIPGIVTPSSTTFNNSSGNYNISGAGGISGPGSLTKFGTASVTLATSNNYSGGTLVNAGTLVIASATAFPANSNLTIAPGAVVDITNQHLVIANASIGAITSDVAAAYNNGAWNGSSAAVAMITSSTAAADTSHLTAVGVATGLTSFEGQNVSSSAVLVKYTYYGDANLDGHVDGTDYSRIDNGYLSQGALTGWYNGDFNYDGVINGSDYTLIDNAYNTQGAAIAAEEATATAQIAGGASAVPEPTALSLLGIAAVGLLGRRRKSC